MATAVLEDLVKGDWVTTSVDATGETPNYYGRRTAQKGAKGQVTRVYSQRVIVRFKMSELNWGGNQGEVSITIPRSAVFKGDQPEPLSKVPEGAISPDDPGLEWLWTRAAQVADAAGHCSEYDKLCDILGIPGREKEHTITINLSGGLKVTGKAKATSRAKAEAIIRQKYADAEILIGA